MTFFWQMARSFYSTTYIYYVTFLANQYKFYPIFNTFAGVFETAAFPLNYALTMKHGKKKCGTIVTPFMILGLAIGLIVTASQPGTSKATFMLILMLVGTELRTVEYTNNYTLANVSLANRIGAIVVVFCHNFHIFTRINRSSRCECVCIFY